MVGEKGLEVRKVEALEKIANELEIMNSPKKYNINSGVLMPEKRCGNGKEKS